MTATARQPVSQAGARWAILLRPRWLAWHAFAVLATLGMLYLGDWQLHRAESGNELSWAYTFEWPLFAVFGVYFWIKTLRDELHQQAAAAAGPGAVPAATGVPAADAITEASAGASASALAAATTVEAAGAIETGRAAPAARRHAESWDATSWDATSWAAASRVGAGGDAGADGDGSPADVSLATPADGEAYLARLRAEVQHHGRWRGWR